MSRISEKKDAVESCLKFWRDSAYKSVCGTMADCFENLGMVFNDLEGEEDERIVFDRPVSGIPPELMYEIKEKYIAGTIESWIESMNVQEKAMTMMRFMNFDHFRMEDFKKRYPNAWRKWTEEEDTALLEAYRSSGEKISWKGLSEKFSRNVNAIKIRLEKLGIELGDNAGRKRY